LTFTQYPSFKETGFECLKIQNTKARTEMPARKQSPKTVSAPVVQAPATPAPVKRSTKTSPKAALAKAASEATTEPTATLPTSTEKTYTEEEIEFFRGCMSEEASERISSVAHLQYYITRGNVPICETPEGFVYREGLAHRFKELQRLKGIVSRADKDPVDYKDHGVDKTISRQELRKMESSFFNELKRIPALLDHGLEETRRREKREFKAQRIEDKVRESRGLLVIRKEILEAMKGSIGKAANLGSSETKKTRTGIHHVHHYQFTGSNLDAVLAMYKRPLPTVRSTVVNILMRYMDEKGIPRGVGKKGEHSKYFSMPKEFVVAFKKVVAREAVDINVEHMIFPEIQKLINYITEPFTGKLSEKEKDDVLTDISMVDFSKAAAQEVKEARAREARETASR
jgi:hypothetical protein